MPLSEGKKARRQTVFGLWFPIKTNRAVSFSDKPDTSPSVSPASDSPSSDPLSTSEAGRDGFKNRLTRSGSKLLSFLGLNSSSNREFVLKTPLIQSDEIELQATSRLLSRRPPRTPILMKVLEVCLLRPRSGSIFALPLMGKRLTPLTPLTLFTFQASHKSQTIQATLR